MLLVQAVVLVVVAVVVVMLAVTRTNILSALPIFKFGLLNLPDIMSVSSLDLKPFTVTAYTTLTRSKFQVVEVLQKFSIHNLL